MDKTIWFDNLLGKKIEARIYRSISVTLAIIVCVMSISIAWMGIYMSKGIKSQRLILTPAVHRKISIPAEAFLSDSYIKAVSKRVIELQEQWSYETLEDNYTELFREYLDHGMSEAIRASLISSKRYDYVKQHKIVSAFKFDWSRSKFSWSEKLERAVALVAGKRKLYINGNDPYSEKDVAYLLVSEGVYPDENNPFAVRLSRLKMDDSGENPFESIKKQYEAAMEGNLPE